jgi:hypothetical protein
LAALTYLVTGQINKQVLIGREDLMSQRQLRLAFVNSSPRTKALKINSLTSRPSRVSCFGSSLQEKVALLQHRKPGAARLIETLVEDALADLPGLPPLE